MSTKQWIKTIGSMTAGFLAASLVVSGCGSKQRLGPALTPMPTVTSVPTSTPIPVAPTATFTPSEATSVETPWKDFAITDFGAVHSPVNGDPNEHLILGAIQISRPAPNLAPELAAFLGRWEGYDYGPPVKKDIKGVLVVQEITPQGGKAFLWVGTNLQYPFWVKEITFKVVPGATPSIEWKGDLAGGPSGVRGMGTFTLAYDRAKRLLKGGVNLPKGTALNGLFQLSQAQSFYVYKDYAQYLASKRIYPKEYRDNVMAQFYGHGYLLYLPEGYEVNPNQTWPLIMFLHGSGDRGDNVFLLAKASPFMMIREKGPLPFIIVAPLLSTSQYYASFPESYLDGVLEQVLADYRVDQKRIYVTGLSMGGEATYRFALHRPDMFAAIAPLSAFLNNADASAMKSIKDLPVWAIHGADDTVVPLAVGQRPVEALKQVGGNVRFSVLEGHDHDVWTDTYSDPQFYDWLLQHQKP
jgi:predicted esterase